MRSLPAHLSFCIALACAYGSAPQSVMAQGCRGVDLCYENDSLAVRLIHPLDLTDPENMGLVEACAGKHAEVAWARPKTRSHSVLIDFELGIVFQDSRSDDEEAWCKEWILLKNESYQSKAVPFSLSPGMTLSNASGRSCLVILLFDSWLPNGRSWNRKDAEWLVARPSLPKGANP